MAIKLARGFHRGGMGKKDSPAYPYPLHNPQADPKTIQLAYQVILPTMHCMELTKSFILCLLTEKQAPLGEYFTEIFS